MGERLCALIPRTLPHLCKPIVRFAVARRRCEISLKSAKRQRTQASPTLCLGGGDVVGLGKSVRFHTIGRLLNGTQFYSSYDDGQPLEVIIGQRMVVPGMEEGLQLFKQGGKGTLYLPSRLGYGTTGFGSQIPPNTIISFEVEILSVN